MLESGELGRIKPSVAELQMRQRWRGAVLWVVRALMIVFLLLTMKTVLIWPMRDIDAAFDTCMKSQAEEARLCMRREIEVRRVPIEEARMSVIALILLTTTAFLEARGGRCDAMAAIKLLSSVGQQAIGK